MNNRGRTATGRAAETVVATCLIAGGWEVLARNWRRGRGELDIVASKGDVLAFVEVKTTDAYGTESLESSIGHGKRTRIIETSKLFIAAHREFKYAVIRYDVASVKAGAIADYFENAFMERT